MLVVHGRSISGDRGRTLGTISEPFRYVSVAPRDHSSTTTRYARIPTVMGGSDSGDRSRRGPIRR